MNLHLSTNLQQSIKTTFCNWDNFEMERILSLAIPVMRVEVQNLTLCNFKNSTPILMKLKKKLKPRKWKVLWWIREMFIFRFQIEIKMMIIDLGICKVTIVYMMKISLRNHLLLQKDQKIAKYLFFHPLQPKDKKKDQSKTQIICKI